MKGVKHGVKVAKGISKVLEELSNVGRKFVNKVKENFGKAVEKVSSGLKSLGAKVGDIKVPVKVNVLSMSAGNGINIPVGIRAETKSVKELVQNFKANGTTKGIDKTRPSWRQSEIDVGNEYPGYREQVSFKDGNEVSHGTKNSSRPDFYIDGHSIEVKNYNVTISSGRSNLIRNVSNQIIKRINDLPEQTKQTVIIDVRGQNVERDILRDIKQKINERTDSAAEIIFKMD